MTKSAVNRDKPTVAVIFHRLGPYHISRLKAATRIFEVIAIEQSAETAEYAWQKVATPPEMRRITLFSATQNGMTARELCQQATETLNRISPLHAVAIPGWSNLAALVALRWCVARNVPCIVMSESTAIDKSRAPWSEWIKKKILALSPAALTGGSRHRDYLVELGFDPRHIFLGYDTVDNDYFRQKTDEVRRRMSEVRKEYGLPEHYFLACARFIENKNLFTLLRAYRDYRTVARESAWDLVLLGEGPLRSDLCHLIFDLHLHDFVLLPGFKQYEELPVFYALAGAFVHASRSEPWGLVVNEAMASGLPIIVSNKCGCVPELLEEGRNGFSFAPEDVDGLAHLLLRMADLPDMEREQMARRSQQIIASWSVERFAYGLRGAVETAECTPRRKVRPIAKLLLSSLILARLARPKTSERASSHSP